MKEFPIETVDVHRPYRPGDELRTVVGPHPFLAPLREAGQDAEGPRLTFDDTFVPTHTAFRAMAEHQQFAVSELALATYVQARAAGKPLTLLPVTLTSRFQHDQLVADAARRRLQPSDLQGRRVGVRSYSQTTGVWVRAILRRQYGLDLDRIEWVVFEQPHVRGFAPPGNVTQVEDEDIQTSFQRGELDAVIGVDVRGGAIEPVIPSPGLAAKAWYDRVGCVTLNHLLTVREDVLEADPEGVQAIYRRFRDAVAGRPDRPVATAPDWSWCSAVELLPVGYSGIFPALRVLADEAYEQGLIVQRLTDDDLSHPLVRDWE